MKSAVLLALEQIGEITGTPVVITDGRLDRPGPSIVYANNALCRMTGYKKEELVGQTPRLFQGPQTNRTMLDHLKQTLTLRKNFQARAVNYRKNGEFYWVEWSIVAIPDSNGDVYYYSNQRDVSLNRERLDVTFSEKSLSAAALQILGASVELNNIIYELSEYVARDDHQSTEADLKQKILNRSQEARQIFEKVIGLLR